MPDTGSILSAKIRGGGPGGGCVFFLQGHGMPLFLCLLIRAHAINHIAIGMLPGCPQLLRDLLHPLDISVSKSEPFIGTTVSAAVGLADSRRQPFRGPT